MSIPSHPLQSHEWGEFRRKTGVTVIEDSSFLLTIHKIPYLPWTIGYFPKGPLPRREMIEELIKIGKHENCIFIQLEPNVIKNKESGTKNYEKDEAEQFISLIHNSKFMILPSAHPLFTKYTFILDLTKSEEELLKNMHQKTRYNIKLAQKHGVEVMEDNSNEAFEQYLKLTKETTKRQGFYAHTENYHRLMWETIGNQKSEIRSRKNKNKLTAHLFLAKLRSPQSGLRNPTLVAWIIFILNDTMYYPYGASSSEYRETMASNLMMWEVIKWGKKQGLKSFDMWGALGPNPNPKDPWFGFHRFKQGYGGKLVEFVGSYDLIINSFLYEVYKMVNKVRWAILKLRS